RRDSRGVRIALSGAGAGPRQPGAGADAPRRGSRRLDRRDDGPAGTLPAFHGKPHGEPSRRGGRPRPLVPRPCPPPPRRAPGARTLVTMLGLFFAPLAMHAVLCHWARIVDALVTVSPLRHEYTRALLDEFRKVGRTTLAGTLLTGVAQGTLAAIGFWITGVPHAVFLT